MKWSCAKQKRVREVFNPLVSTILTCQIHMQLNATYIPTNLQMIKTHNEVRTINLNIFAHTNKIRDVYESWKLNGPHIPELQTFELIRSFPAVVQRALITTGRVVTVRSFRQQSRRLLKHGNKSAPRESKGSRFEIL